MTGAFFCNVLFNPASAVLELRKPVSRLTRICSSECAAVVKPIVGDRMHSQELSGSEERSEGVPHYGFREMSLIGLAANLDDPLCRRKLFIIFAKVNSTISALAPQRRGHRVLSRYIE